MDLQGLLMLEGTVANLALEMLLAGVGDKMVSDVARPVKLTVAVTNETLVL